MTEYSFTLKFDFPDRVRVASASAEALQDANRQLDSNSYIDRLYESGCDDALIGVGKQGCIALDFIREASSAFEAISSAIADVKKAIPTATLIEAAPDFVGLTDTAKILGCTRQNMRNLIFNSQTKSPFPIYEGTPAIWHLAEILTWLKEDKIYSIDDALLEVAKINMEFNLARKWRKVEPSIQEDIKAFLARWLF